MFTHINAEQYTNRKANYVQFIIILAVFIYIYIYSQYNSNQYSIYSIYSKDVYNRKIKNKIK